MIAIANEGYTFINWTKDGTQVSTEATYTFTVNEAAAYVANFEEVVTTVTQTCQFNTGWNWWTPNVDLDGATLLSLLEQGLGSNGITIIAQNGSNATNSSYGWTGSPSIELGQMFMIKVNADCSFTLTGNAINLADHTITLYHGNNWIGFFGSQTMSVNNALANLSASVGDVILSQNGTSASYSAYGWGGTLQNLVPGEAYIYISTSSENITFSFPSNNK